MIDDDLLALERATRKDPLAALRLARALERAGRQADVVPALLLGVVDPGVRRAVVQASRVPLPVRKPRLKWLVKLDGHDRFLGLLASPLGIVTWSRQRTFVLDPDSGETRHRLLPSRSPALAEEVLLLMQRSRHLAAHDLWTGEPLYSPRIEGSERFVGYRGGHLVTRRKDEVIVYRLPEPRREPVLAWRVPAFDADELEQTIVADDAVVVSNGDGIVAHGLAGGEARWTREAATAVVLGAEATEVVLHLHDGPFVLVRATDGSTLKTFPSDDHGELTTLLRDDAVMVGDELYAARGRSVLATQGFGGKQLWGWLSPMDEVVVMRLTGGRLYALLGSRAVVCLEEDAPHGPRT